MKLLSFKQTAEFLTISHSPGKWRERFSGICTGITRHSRTRTGRGSSSTDGRILKQHRSSGRQNTVYDCEIAWNCRYGLSVHHWSVGDCDNSAGEWSDLESGFRSFCDPAARPDQPQTWQGQTTQHRLAQVHDSIRPQIQSQVMTNNEWIYWWIGGIRINVRIVKSRTTCKRLFIK